MKKICLLLFITVLSFCSSFAQFKYLKQAKEAINEKKYEVAIEKIETYQKKEGINLGFFYLKFLLNNAIDHDINKVDSANFYLTLCINELSKLSLKEKELSIVVYNDFLFFNFFA